MGWRVGDARVEGLTAQDGNSAAMESQACWAVVRMVRERMERMSRKCILIEFEKWLAMVWVVIIL